MACVNLGIISIGDCASKQNTVNNINLNQISQKLSQTVAETNQSASSLALNVQNQNVKINGYTGAVDIKITQSMNVQIASKSKISASIKSEDMKELAQSLNTQLDEMTKQTSDIGVPPAVQNKVNNVKKSITSVVTSSTLLKTMQKSMAEAVSVQNQDIIINFAELDSGAIENIVNQYKKDSQGGRPVISIDQTLIASIQQEAALSSITESIAKDKNVQASVEELKSTLVQEQIGFGNVSKDLIKEAGESVRKVSGDVKDLGETVAKEGFAFAKWIPIMIGLVIIAVILGFVFLGKSVVSNPEAIKAIGGMAKPKIPGLGFGWGGR
jgi:hypothetical protein